MLDYVERYSPELQCLSGFHVQVMCPLSWPQGMVNLGTDHQMNWNNMPVWVT